MSRWLGLAVAMSATALVAAGCGDSGSGGGGGGGGGGGSSTSSTSASGKSDPGHSGPYRILDITSLTGPIGPFGTAEVQGLKAAVKQLNTTGGINGHKVVYTIKDAGSDPTKAVTFLQQALQGSSKPDFVSAGVTGSDALALTPLANAAKIINWTAAPATKVGDPSKSPYTFVTNAAYDSFGRLNARAIAKRGIKTAAIIQPDDEPGNNSASGFKDEFSKLGGKTVGVEKFNPTALDLTSTFEKAKASNPGAFFVINEGQGAQELKAHAAAAPEILFQGDNGFIVDFTKQGLTKKQLANTYGSGESIILRTPAQRSQRQQDYVKYLNEVGGDKGLGLVLPGLMYDGIMATAQAAKQANSIDGPTVTKALENLQGDNSFGLGYNYGFSPTNHFVPLEPAPQVPFPLDAPYKDGYFIVKGGGTG